MIPRGILLLLLSTLLTVQSLTGRPLRAPAADSSMAADTVRMSTGRVVLIGGVLAASMVTIHLYQQQGWWRDNRAPFHFEEDLVYGLGVDKIGHFYGGSLLSYGFQNSFAWAGMRGDEALWWGSAASLLFQTYVEVEDGFSAWGFDRVDFASDLGGASWPVLRHYLPALQTVDLKLSYAPSPLLGTPGGSGFRGQHHLVIDDYEGQNFWLSVKVDRLLPEPAARLWPDFLCIAVGYGAREVAGPSPYGVWFLGLDYDMTKVVPQTSGFLKKLGEVLNFVHFPAPAVRFAPSAIWYGLYFAG